MRYDEIAAKPRRLFLVGVTMGVTEWSVKPPLPANEGVRLAKRRSVRIARPDGQLTFSDYRIMPKKKAPIGNRSTIGRQRLPVPKD